MEKSSSIHATDINIIRKKHMKLFITGLILLALIIVSGSITNYNHIDGLASIPAALQWLFANMYFSGSTLSRLPTVLRLLWETILISIVSTTTAAFFAMIFAIVGSKRTSVNGFLMYFAKLVASISRNIPVVAWALILVLSFGTNAATGFLALFFGTFGFLVRAFIETIDETSGDTVEALKATGATYPQVISKAVIPESMPQMFSWVLFMIETNIRSATLVGLLTGTGIGYLFDLYYKQLNYEMVSLITLAIVVAVLIIEAISNLIRREIL
ncbi:PhnE/PtxC family ABC transporter permease [Salinicoccus hispanicus]|uniref:ABC transporter permease subunit n=1 Tax=Salinicoccus hispanicus TaxID=157225 RepID=A0A6N8U496_9STAP|nr:phosphate/phosphonate ABC transporter permease [Salinicoccus hispanicus]MXQ51071.1 ABC transporter permease subunit [Salinicoccus hispanicus]